MNFRFFLILLASAYSQALYPATGATEIKATEQCSYYGETLPGTFYAFTADYTAEAIIDKITSYTGLRRNFMVRSSNVPNASAVIQDGQRFLLYNQEFMEAVRQKTHSYWAAVSIMAHEVGHHLQGHTLDGEAGRPSRELEADEYSGFILQKMGATLEDAQAAMNALAPTTGSNSHPPRNARLLAIRAGWTKSFELNGSPRPSPFPSPSITPINQPPVLLPQSQPPVATLPILTTPIPASPIISQPTGPSYQPAHAERVGRYEIMEGLVNDSETGLTWTRCSIGQRWDGITCQGMIKRVSWDEISTKHFDFSGYNDWRVPTIKELRTLFYCSSAQPATWNNTGTACVGNYIKPAIFSRAFPNTVSDIGFLSSSPLDYDSSRVWIADFNIGNSRSEHKYDSFAVRLVRGAASF